VARKAPEFRRWIQAQGQPQVAVLSAVAVDPRLRGRGVGVRLVSHFLHQSQLGGAGTAELVTSTEPEGAAVFYERLGWSAVGDYRTPDGNALRIYRYTVGAGPEPGAEAE